ncbi:MAG: beta-hydroxyacyl-ACP dehydratase [Bacteroidales bacterium]|jgi:3-hydroxyacyl-[acyl-carrier-protein] dehydratase|nr:beta-hydroxyacyl-ACP dehydratase [Bacteroidales bacterium]
MLLGRFFNITSIETLAAQHYRVSVTLVPEHPVYEGHFPGNPVVPGVCSLHMIVECAGEALGYPVVMYQAQVVKFLGVIRPSSDMALGIDLLLDDEMALKAAITSGERRVMACKAKLKRL